MTASLPRVVDLEEAFGRIRETWSPRRAARVGDYDVRLARLEGPFCWHAHDDEDELFLVLEGRLRILFRDGEVALGPQQLVVVPRGVEHKPVADGPVRVLLLEPSTTRNTGGETNEMTVEDVEPI